MSFAWTRRTALGGLLLAVACKGSAEAPSPALTDASADASPSPAITFSFDTSYACAGGGLCAPPSQVITLGIDATPDEAITVALEGSYGDAALTADHVTTTGGHALVSLETSTAPAAFTILARAGTDANAPKATLAVAVGASGFAIVRASPSYAGKRPAPGFLATAVAPSTCNDLAATPPSNPAWLPAANGTPIVIPVPAEEPVALDARIGHYAIGCADIAPLAASVTREVSVDVYDVPMALALTNMSATFTFTPSTDAASSWRSTMTVAASNVAGRFFGSASDGKALLDAMRAEVAAADQAQFDQTRTQQGWDASASTWLTSHAPSIRDRAAAWLTTAASDGIGALAMHLGAGPSAGTTAVTPTSFGPLTAALAGVATPAPFNWSADADDTVHLAGTVPIASSPYIGHLADIHAASDAPSATSNVAGAIASQIDCAGLASALVGAGDAYGACGASCFGGVCVSALASAWTSALASPTTGTDAVTLSLTVGAPAEVGDEAEPQYFQGGWLGQIDGPIVSSPFSILGTVVSEEPAGAKP